ncbi:MAG: histidine kinase [Clostridiales bacterium]|nr:histidine kinase [Clostridiales bacterium]
MQQKQEKKMTRSIRTQILSIMMALVLPLNALVLFSTINSIYVLQEQAKVSLTSIEGFYMQQLEHRISSIHYYFYDLEENDADFIRLLERNKEDDNRYFRAQTNIARKFNTHITTSAVADSYFYLNQANDDLLVVLPTAYGGSITAQQRDAVVQWIGSMDFPGNQRWKLIEIADDQWLMRLYHKGDFYYGALIYVDHMIDQMKEAIPFDGIAITAASTKNTESPHGWITASQYSTAANFGLQLAVPTAEVILTLPLTQWFAIAFAIVYLLCVPVLYLVLNKLLLRPLDKIRSALLKMKSGEREYRIREHRYAEEFRTINDTFNEMADNIETLKIENYEKELARKKMELKNLQLQIRPHFLLNTFNLIFNLAEIREYESVQKFALYLSNYFRYIFRSGQELSPLQKEFELIREYLEVSAIRYPDCFTVHQELSSELAEFMVPPLLVHNFAENIINHTVKFGRTIHIHLSATALDGYASIQIQDDGEGMDAAIADEINQGIFDAREQGRVHVGLENSYRRIQHFYGPSSSLKVTSIAGKGTCITLSLQMKQAGTEEERI